MDFLLQSPESEDDLTPAPADAGPPGDVGTLAVSGAVRTTWVDRKSTLRLDIADDPLLQACVAELKIDFSPGGWTG
jgi:hypothetical protein